MATGPVARDDVHAGTRLTPFDASFLELEDGDESAHMHVGWTMVFDPLPEGGVPPLARVQEELERRLEILPRFRCRLSSPRVGRFSWPTWEPDSGFEIANQTRHATLPAPGGEAELMDWLGDFYSHRLDRTRPLWEMTLLDGLAGGRWAIAAKVHHSLIDGVSGSWVTTVLLDAEPHPGPGSKGVLEALLPDGGNGGETGGGQHSGSRLGALAGGARAGLDVALHPGRVGTLLSQSRAIAEFIVREEVIGGSPTSINVRIGGSRRLAALEVPLADLKAIKRELGGTVNDVVLAATAGGLRRLFEQRGEELSEGVRAMVPVSVRGEGERLALGNRVSSLFVELPVAEPDPVLRYCKTVGAAEELKRSNQAIGAEALTELAGMAPPLLHGAVARASFTPRLFNLTITNVPGPQSTLYAFGAPLQRVVPLVPIYAGHAVGVAVVSYDGKVTFGLNGDRARVPDIAVLRDGIEESLAALRPRQRRGKRPARRSAARAAAATRGSSSLRPARRSAAPRPAFRSR
jgi:diacylglycerol O-acyltransferase